MKVKLIWDKVSDLEWQAGGLGKVYSIRLFPDKPKATYHAAHYSLYRTEGDGPAMYMTSSGSRDFLEQVAQVHCDK